mgnify:CR=1 FL=1
MVYQIRKTKYCSTILKYADDTFTIGNSAADADFVNYLDEISSIIFLSQILDNLQPQSKWLSIAMENKLRF